MKVHTSAFKENIVKAAREIDSIITYTLNNTEITLDAEDLNAVTPHFKSNILKSAMKELEIDSNVEIPKGTIVNYQFGLKVNDTYEYINFGNYIVDKVEKQEDTQSYKITCYDKMLYSMVEYDEINITYPTTVRTYLNAICQKLGLTFKNANSSFVNYNKTIGTDLYKGLQYTFRDVIDEIAQVTASTICINEDDDSLEIRYINNTGDEINEEYLKNVNVNFKEKYGPINTIVFSRSAGADKIALSYPENLPDDEKNAIEIADNQILNFNNRGEFIDEILNKLYGLEYYLNDFASFGIGYYNLCDKYNIVVGENTYPCIMFNDEFLVTQGLEENVYTEMPEGTETDYTKTDKTDRKINQTYLIVDKQNQTIESVVSNVNEQNTKISQITQTVDEINSKIQDIADITISGESNYATITLENISESEPIQIKVRPTYENISYVYPTISSDLEMLYPSDNLYMSARTIRFTNISSYEITQDEKYTNYRSYYSYDGTNYVLLINGTDYQAGDIITGTIYQNKEIDYEIPNDLLLYNADIYDEFYLDYDSQTCQVIKRCQYNSDYDVILLPQEQIINYPYPSINLDDGDYTISIIGFLGYHHGYLFVRLMAKNIYTSQFYTKAETNSRINQKADEINLGVTQTLSNYSTTNQMNSAINLKANEITSTVSETYATKTTTNQLSTRIAQTAKGISLTVNNGSTSSGITIGVTKEDGTTEQTSGTIQMNGLVKFTDLSGSGTTTINGSNIQTGTLSASKITTGTLSANRVSGGTLQGSSVIATSGRIGGWTLEQNALSAENGSHKVILTNISNSNQDFIVVKNGDNYPFWVRGDGTLYAGNATINGTVNASSGSFTGTVNATSGSFSGSIYAGSGNIGAWTLNSTGIYSSDAQIFPTYLGYKYNGTGGWTSQAWWRIGQAASDKRLKKNINSLEDKYNKFFDELKPVSFKWKDDKKEKEHIGFIAQDIQEAEKNNGLDLDIVYKNETDDYLNLDKRELIALNTWQIQKLKEEIKELKQELETLKKEAK